MKNIHVNSKSSPSSPEKYSIDTILPILTFFSGLAALIYESLWMRSFGLIFGNTTYAITVILATYMFGIALGSYFVGKIKVTKPLKVYIIVEAGIGVSAFIAYMLLQILPGLWGGFLQKVPLIPIMEMPLRIIFSGLIILIPTLLMGATVPLLVEIISYHKSRHAALSRLYSMNTLGGAMGVLLSIFVLFPSLGLSKTYDTAIIINFLIAIFCILVNRANISSPIPTPINEVTSQKEKIPGIRKWNGFWMFNIIAALVGGTSFCLEILWSRSFVLVIGSSIYAFNLMLFSFLLGIVLGSWIYEKVWPKIKNPSYILVLLLFAIGTGILASVFAIGKLPLLYLDLMNFFPVKFWVHQILGFSLCFIVMVILTTAFGFIFPMLLHLLKDEKQDMVGAREATARLYAWNTFGTILGALITGFVLIPFFGLQKSYMCIALIPFLLGLMLLGRLKVLKYSIQIVLMTAVLTGLFFLFSFWNPWEPVVMSSGIYKFGLRIDKKEHLTGNMFLKTMKAVENILYYKEGSEGVVSVAHTKKEYTYLAINGKTDGGTQDVVTQKFLAYVPLILHPDPKKVLVIGWGTGCTAGVAGLFPIKTLDAVEIEPEVFNTSYLFADINRKVYLDKRLKIIFKDGRNYLLTTPLSYDIIITEPSNPWITGVSNLFTRDFYKIGLSRLEQHGIFCQWFHIYDISLEVMQSQIKTFCSVFPNVTLWIVPPTKQQMEQKDFLYSDIILIGSRNHVNIDISKIGKFYSMPEIREDLNSMGIGNPLSFVSNAILERGQLQRFSESARLNTDDYPYIEFNAPHGLFQTDSGAEKLLVSLHKNLEDFDTALSPPIINNPIQAWDNKAKNLGFFYETLGDLYFKKNMLNRAERLYRKSLLLDSNLVGSAESMLNMSLMNYRNEEALYWCKMIIHINSQNLKAWSTLAAIYCFLGRFDEGKAVYKEMTFKFPQKAHGPFGMGMIYYKERDFAKASIYLHLALERDSSIQQARQILKSLGKL